MQIPKPSEQDKEAFRALVEGDPRVEVKPMFGNLGAFVNGNMFAGLFGPALGVRLPEAGAEELRSKGGGPFGPEERPMGGYVSIPGSMGGTEREGWVGAALDHAASMPPKQKKAK